jgi:Flp pilus assembly pilin Flp
VAAYALPYCCPTVLDRPWSLEHNQPLGATSDQFRAKRPTRGRRSMTIFSELWVDDQGQDIAEYAVMLAVILVLVVGTVRLIGSSANNAFSTVASALQ